MSYKRYTHIVFQVSGTSSTPLIAAKATSRDATGVKLQFKNAVNAVPIETTKADSTPKQIQKPQTAPKEQSFLEWAYERLRIKAKIKFSLPAE